MTPVTRLATIAALGASLGGCIAAVVPIAASSAIVKQRVSAGKQAGPSRSEQPSPRPPATAVSTTQTPTENWKRVGGLTAMPPPSGIAPAATPARNVPPGMQYLYGSGEAAALSVQAYGALTRYLRAQVVAAKFGEMRQVVLADGASLNAPRFEPCGRKPLAIVLDIDETALLNLGYEADEARRGLAYDEARWQRWERTGANRTVAVPGVVGAIAEARRAGITVIFNSNRTRESARATADALVHAGLGPVKHGATLWLKGDDGGGSNKDDRRWSIASGHCVIALVGDQLGDFSDLFNDPKLTPSTRRALSGAPEVAGMWGNGWFLLPNPVYGTALKGGFDDIFPYDMRWTDPAEVPGSRPAAPTPPPTEGTPN